METPDTPHKEHDMKVNIKTIQEVAILATLNSGKWTEKKIDPNVTQDAIVQYKSEQDAGAFYKILVNRTAFREMNVIVSRARAYHRDRTFPWMFDGTGILAISLFDEYQAFMNQCILDYEDAVERFMDYYINDLLIKEGKRLGNMFNPMDYPSPEEVKSSFYLRATYSPVNNPNDIRVSIQGKTKEELEKMVIKAHEDALEEMQRSVFKRLSKVIGKMAETLEKDKCFTSTLITNIEDLLSIVDGYREILDYNTRNLLDQIRCSLTLHSAEELRDNKDKKYEIADKAREVTEKLAAYF